MRSWRTIDPGTRLEKERQFPAVRPGSGLARESVEKKSTLPVLCIFCWKTRSLIIRMCNFPKLMGKYKAKHLCKIRHFSSIFSTKTSKFSKKPHFSARFVMWFGASVEKSRLIVLRRTSHWADPGRSTSHDHRRERFTVLRSPAGCETAALPSPCPRWRWRHSEIRLLRAGRRVPPR